MAYAPGPLMPLGEPTPVEEAEPVECPRVGRQWGVAGRGCNPGYPGLYGSKTVNTLIEANGGLLGKAGPGTGGNHSSQ